MTAICQAILASRGGLTEDMNILDFGCGSGRHVKEFRSAGFQAVGVDQRTADRTVAEDFLHVSDEQGRFPFEDASFDFCYSTSVFEHVMDYDAALAEISRVLRPGAWSLHVFPARWRPVEPHIFTPFGGRFQQSWLLRLWAGLGIRNSFQRELTAAETAARNLEYCRTGLNYPTQREIAGVFGRHFSRVDFVENEFVQANREVSRVSGLVAPYLGVPGMRGLYRGFHTRVVLVQK